MKQVEQHREYIHRINRALDYIQSNLDKPLLLAEVASVAHFSPFHFHRIFGAMLGETFTSFIQRLRVEKGASLLLANPRESITTIAFACGCASSASFARLFRTHFGMSASQWRSGGAERYRKNGQTLSKNRKDTAAPDGYFFTIEQDEGARTCLVSQSQAVRSSSMSRFSDTRVEVRQFSPMPVAYVRHIGPYKGDNALFERLWGTLMRWAGPRGLLQQPALKCLCLYHDDPNVTDESHLRTSVCISVPPQTAVSGEVGLMEVPGGSYAAAYCELDSSEYEQAWNWVYGQWLPHSGYQPDDRPCFELMLNDPATHPQHKHVVEICVPVRPL